jgi:hypothetical protein
MTLLLLISGFIENFLNILVFTNLKIFHSNQCAFLLIIESIIDISQVVITLTSRILTDAFPIDPAQKSVI